VAADFITAMGNDVNEIRVGKTQYMYDLNLKSPAEALQLMQLA
jgi:hypothetical protein